MVGGGAPGATEHEDERGIGTAESSSCAGNRNVRPDQREVEREVNARTHNHLSRRLPPVSDHWVETLVE